MKLDCAVLLVGATVVLASDKGRLIRTWDDVRYMNDGEVQQLVRDGIRFMDITYGGDLCPRFSPAKMPAFSEELDQGTEDEVRSLLGDLDVKRMKRNLLKLTNFHNRYYKAECGKAASEWVYRMLKHMTKDSPMKITVQRLLHKRWPQFSVRCRIENPTGTMDMRERIILSAHLDSTAMFAPMIMPAPGADDDGSGVVTQMEVIRLISLRKWRLTRPLDFIFFAAEEGGLLGSQNVVRHYQDYGIAAAVLHIDMDGFMKRGSLESIGVLMDNTNPKLTSFLIRIIERYTSVPVKRTVCGYACSDHYSWHIAGYPAVALFEGSFGEINPYIHTSSDTVEKIDFKHMAEFVRIALAFALHMTESSRH